MPDGDEPFEKSKKMDQVMAITFVECRRVESGWRWSCILRIKHFTLSTLSGFTCIMFRDLFATRDLARGYKSVDTALHNSQSWMIDVFTTHSTIARYTFIHRYQRRSQVTARQLEKTHRDQWTITAAPHFQHRHDRSRPNIHSGPLRRSYT